MRGNVLSVCSNKSKTVFASRKNKRSYLTESKLSAEIEKINNLYKHDIAASFTKGLACGILLMQTKFDFEIIAPCAICWYSINVI